MAGIFDPPPTTFFAAAGGKVVVHRYRGPLLGPILDWGPQVAFWKKWPSWLVEMGSGIGTVAFARVTLGSIPVPEWMVEHVPFGMAAATLAVVFSFIYERFIDRNGFSWVDIGQRSAGIAIGIVLWTYVPVPLIPIPL